MLLSIIVPLYNVSQYINKCLNSLVNQDIDNYEILIINDCSTDDSLEKAQLWQNKYDFIKVINKEYNSGLSDTRNRGLKEAKGEYILFIDSDDYIDNNSLGKLMKEILLYKPDILYFGYIVETKNKSSKIYNYKSQGDSLYINNDFMMRELQQRNLPIPACVACYKKNLITENELYFETGILHEDVRWSPEILFKATKVYTSELCFYHYVLRSNSISQKHDRKKNGRDLLLTCKYLERLSKSFRNSNLQKAFLNYIAMTYMKAVAVNDMVKDKECDIDRKFPLKRINNVKDFIKAFVFLISPDFYSKVYMFIKIKIKKDTL